MDEMDEKDTVTLELASGYALGVLDPAEAAAFEQRLQRDSTAAAEVAAYQQVAAYLAEAAPLVRPAPRVKDALFARIGASAKTAQKQVPNAVGHMANVLVRAGEGRWIKTPFPGVELKQLFVDPFTGMITTLLRAAAGAIYPAHEHGGLEQVYVIDGDIVFDDHELDTGDYEVSAGHTHHSSLRAPEGCLALIIHSPHDRVLPE